MKFLLELVPCCGSPTSERRKIPPGPPPPPPPPPHESDDDYDVMSLVPPPPLTKRVRTVVSAARSRSPSLGVISEDKAVSTVQRRVAAAEFAGSGRAGTGRRTSGGNNAADRWRAPDRDRRRRDRDDYERGRSTLPTTMIPAFSPTPFLF